MDMSEISFIGRFQEALSQVDFDVLIKDILIFEQSFDKERRTDIRTHSNGQKRKLNPKTSENMRPTANSTSGSGSTGKKPACASKLDEAVHVSEVEILFEERSKSCQTSLYIEGDLINEFPETNLESKPAFSRYKDASKPHKHIKTYSAKFNKGKSIKAKDIASIASTSSSHSGSRDIDVKNIASTSSSQSGSRGTEVKNIASTSSSQSGPRDIMVKNIASTSSSQLGSRDIDVKNIASIASTSSSQSGSRDIDVKNIASTSSSQSGSWWTEVNNIASTTSSRSGPRHIKVKKIASTSSSQSGSWGIEVKNIASTSSSQSRSRGIETTNIASNNSSQSDMLREVQKPLQTHHATEREDIASKTLLKDYKKTVSKYDKSSDMATADVDINVNGLEEHVAHTAMNSDDLTLSIVAPTAVRSDDLNLSVVAPTAFNSDNLTLSIVAPTAVRSDDLNLSIVAPTAITIDNLTLSIVAPTAINSDNLTLSIVAPTAINSDNLTLSIVAPTTINNDDLALSIVAPTAVNSDDLTLSIFPKLSIFSNENDVKNRENTPQFDCKQPNWEQISEFQHRTNSVFLNSTVLLSYSRHGTFSGEEEKGDAVTAENNSSIPEFSKVTKTLDTHFMTANDNTEAKRLRVECDFAGEQTLTTAEAFMHKNDKEKNEVENNEQNPVTPILGHKEMSGNSSIAIETQNLRDIAFPGSLCSVLYEEVLKQDRAELESIAEMLEQAQEKCFTMAPRTPEERKLLLESQKQERMERSLKVQNENSDELKQRLFDTIIHFLEIKVVETVKFAKYIPGFKTLDIADQITLIKDANLINLTPHVCRVINSETQLVTYLPGLHVGFEEFCENFSEEIREMLKLGESKGNQLNITAREEALLQAIFLVSTCERNSLQNSDIVEEIYRKLVSCLLHVASMGPTPVFQRMDQLSDMILFARHLREYHYRVMLRQIINFAKDTNELTIHEIYEKFM